MLCGGLVGGLLHRWRPKLAQHPLTGFCLTLGISLLRSGLIFWLAPHSPAAPHRIEEIGVASVLRGVGTASKRDFIVSESFLRKSWPGSFKTIGSEISESFLWSERRVSTGVHKGSL
jgi:hypothetical protein